MSALKLSAGLLALVLCSAAIGLPSAPPRPGAHACPTVSDPDPLDCPFCAGNPAVHFKAIWALEKRIATACIAILI